MTVWGEGLGARPTPGGSTQTGSTRRWRRPFARSSATAPRFAPRPSRTPSTGSRETCSRAQTFSVVGPSRARGRERRRRRPGGPARARRDGPRRPPLEPLFEAVSSADGDALQPPVAQRRRARGRLDGRAGARHRRGRATRVRHSRARDVRGVLRHPAAGRARLHQLLRRRRGVSQRLLLDPGARQDLLLQSRATRRFPSTGSRRSRACSRTPSGGRAGERLRSRRRRRRSRPSAGTRRSTRRRERAR